MKRFGQFNSIMKAQYRATEIENLNHSKNKNANDPTYSDYHEYGLIYLDKLNRLFDDIIDILNMNDIETGISLTVGDKDITIYRVDFNKGPQGRVFADVVQFTTGYLFEEEPSESSIDYEELNLRNDFFNNMVKNVWLKHFVLTLGLGNMAIRLDDNKEDGSTTTIEARQSRIDIRDPSSLYDINITNDNTPILFRDYKLLNQIIISQLNNLFDNKGSIYFAE